MATPAQNLVAIALAKHIYEARTQFFDVDVPAWESLAPRSKHEYVEHAQDILEAVRPAPVLRRDWFGTAAMLARREAERVLETPLPRRQL